MSVNATIYRCNAALSDGAIVPGKVWRVRDNVGRCAEKASKRTKVAGDFVAVCDAHNVKGGREATVATAVTTITDGMLAAAYAEITPAMLRQADKRAATFVWQNNVGASNADDVAAMIVDTFARYRARDIADGSNRSVDDAWHAALTVKVTLPEYPVDAEREGTACVALTMEGFGDGLRADVLDAMTAENAAILRMWQDGVTTREPRANGTDATAYGRGTMITVYPEATATVQAAAAEYIATAALVNEYDGWPPVTRRGKDAQDWSAWRAERMLSDRAGSPWENLH